MPARVPAEVKDLFLKSVDEAVAVGFANTWAYSLWRVSDSRVHRWRARRRDTGTLVDRAPGGVRGSPQSILDRELNPVLDRQCKNIIGEIPVREFVKFRHCVAQAPLGGLGVRSMRSQETSSPR